VDIGSGHDQLNSLGKGSIGDGGGSLELIKNGGDLNEGLVGLFSFFVLLVSFNHCA